MRDPSAEISPEWQGGFIRTRDGRRHLSRQIDVGDDAVELYTRADGFVTFDHDDIETYGLAEASLMPPRLDARLTPGDLRDLLAFLESTVDD